MKVLVTWPNSPGFNTIKVYTDNSFSELEMRAIIQCVSSASVTGIDGACWDWIRIDDNDTDVSALSKKILSLRVFVDPSNPDKMWKANVKDIDGDILCVSQFTLLANTTKGNKPDFHRAMATEPSRRLYATFLDALSMSYKADKIQDGRFGAMMSVNLTNEGPITFILDSRKFEYVEVPENSKIPRTLNNSTESAASPSGAIATDSS